MLEPRISLLLGQDDHDGKSSAELQTDIIREDYPGISDSALNEILRLRLLTGTMVRNRTRLLSFREAVIAGLAQEDSQKL